MHLWCAVLALTSDLFVEGGRIEEDIPLQQEQHSPILMEDFCLYLFAFYHKNTLQLRKSCGGHDLFLCFILTNMPRYTGLFENKHYFLIILHELHKMQYFVTISKTFYILAFYRSNELKWCSAINCRNWLF